VRSTSSTSGRLKSLQSVIYFAYMNAAHQPHIFSLDYERSLRAAYLPEDFARFTQERLGPGPCLYTTRPVRFWCSLRPRPPDGDDARLTFPFAFPEGGIARRYRRDLDLIRRLFRLGGLRDDPFR